MRPDAWLALLHLLIPVYWLGGDLGVFFASFFVTDARRTPAERLIALKILLNLDMGPRTALILALPTGLSLAVARGWVALAAPWLGLIWAGALIWLAIAWRLHLAHGAPARGLRAVDMIVRWSSASLLTAIGFAGLLHYVALPWFIAAKLLVLGIAVFLGLMIRAMIQPLPPLIAAMRQNGPTPENDHAIRALMMRSRYPVLAIWGLVLVASFLGLATPV